MAGRDTLGMVEAERDRHHENAIHALTQLSFEAQDKLKKLMEEGRIETTVSGSCLNHQLFMDAERNLTLYWAWASAAEWLKTDIAMDRGIAEPGHLDLVIVNMQDDGWICSDAGGSLWWFGSPQFYVNLTTGHDDEDSQVEPGHNIRVKRTDVKPMDGSEVHEVLN